MNNDLQKSQKQPLSWLAVIGIALILVQQFRGHENSDLIKLAAFPFMLCLLLWSIKPDSMFVKIGVAAAAGVSSFCLWGDLTFISIVTPILSCAAAFLVQYVTKKIRAK